ncbi:MAG: hypothetical protein WCP98_18575 [Actinomycetes bacterium]
MAPRRRAVVGEIVVAHELGCAASFTSAPTCAATARRPGDRDRRSRDPGLAGLRTPFGTRRVLDMPVGELLPRIC